MLYDIAFAITIFIACSSLGSLLILLNPRPLKQEGNFESNFFLGLSFFLITSGWLAYFNITIGKGQKIFFLTFLMLISLFVLFKFNFGRFSHIKFKLSFLRLAPIFGSIYVGVLFNPSFNKSQFAYRNGPDLVGWTDSVSFFAQGGTIHSLAGRVLSVFPGSNLKQIFSLPSHAEAIHLYRIPSFTDQINAEFIVGANRFTLQYFLGQFASLTSPKYLVSWVIGFILLNAYLQISISIKILKLYGLRDYLVGLIAIAVCLGLNVLEPLLEGGLGQYFSVSALLYLLYLVKMNRSRSVVFLLICSGMTLAYFDALLFLLVFGSIYLLIKIAYERKFDFDFIEYLHGQRFLF